MYYFVMKFFPQMWQCQLNLCDLHVEKKFKAMHCEVFGKFFNKNWESGNTLQKAPNLFWFPVKDNNILNIFSVSKTKAN